MNSRTRRSFSLISLSFALVASTLGLATKASAVTCVDTVAGQLARWPGDSSAAEVAHGRDGTLVGGTAYGTGKVDKGFSFDGADDVVTVPDDPDWSLAGDFSIDTWVRFTGFHPHAQALVAQDEGSGLTSKWMFWYAAGGALAFEFGGEGAGYIPVSAPWSPTISDWYHVAVTRSGADFTLYINGVVVDTGTETTPIWDAAAPLTLGWGETDWFFDGSLDEPEIYQRAMSAAEIKAIYDAGSLPRCAITRSTLSLTGPATAYPGDTVSLNGTLALSGGALVDGLPIGITRSVNGGTPTALPGAAAAADGSFSFQDVPSAGTVVYRATFAGATNVSAESAFVTTVVAKGASALSLSVSKSKLQYGDAITVAAHLNGGFTNKTVTIWATPYGESKRKLAEGTVNGSGTLSVKDKPARKTTYEATYAGDARWDPSQATRVVDLAARWSVRSIGGYANVNGYRLYHYTPKCTSSNSTYCPKALFKLAPRHSGQRVNFEAKYCKNGQCYSDRATYRLNRKSQTIIFFWFADSRAIGWTLKYRLIFKGDADHLASTSAWAKAKMTA